MRLRSIAEVSGYQGFGPAHNILFEVEQVPEADTSALPRVDGANSIETDYTTPLQTSSMAPADSAKDPRKQFSNILEVCAEGAVFSRAAVAWGLLRNISRVFWCSVQAAWATPSLFGRYSDPNAGVGGVAGGEDAVDSTSPSLDWRQLWRLASVMLDFLEAVGRQRIEKYFGQGIPAGVTADQCVRISCSRCCFPCVIFLIELLHRGEQEGGGASIGDSKSEGSHDTKAEEGPGFGVSDTAEQLPPGVKPDDLAWMAQLLSFTAQALCYAGQWTFLIHFTDRCHNVFPAHLLAPRDPHDPDGQQKPLIWSMAEVCGVYCCGLLSC
jgi:hypothetical protein